MKLTAQRLTLPLFLFSRNQIKYNHKDFMQYYITKNEVLYTKGCKQPEISTSGKKFKKMAGYYEPKTKPPECNLWQYQKSAFRELNDIKSWHLPPNMYSVSKKQHNVVNKVDTNLKKPKPIQQKMAKEVKKWKRCKSKMVVAQQQGAGILLSNLRLTYPSSRIFHNTLAQCYRDPNAPAAAHYYPKQHEISAQFKRKSFVSKTTDLLGMSAVAINNTNIQIQPPVGAYENRYEITCCCKSKKKITPGLQLLIDREKRNKFRKLPYKKIQRKMHFSPDWGHVKGHGLRSLFKSPQNFIDHYQNKLNENAMHHQMTNAYFQNLRKLLTEIEYTHTPTKKKTQKSPRESVQINKLSEKRKAQLPQYINMINNPKRKKISFRDYKLPYPLPKIRFNCNVKPMDRRIMLNKLKQLHKSQFMKRRRQYSRNTFLKLHRKLKILESLGTIKHITNQPITDKRLSRVQSKYFDLAEFKLEGTSKKIRRLYFYIMQLPKRKLLCRESDYMPPVRPNYKKSFYEKEVLLSDYLDTTEGLPANFENLKSQFKQIIKN